MQRKVKELVNESSSSLLKQRFKLLFKDFLGQWGSLSSSSNWTKSSRACSQTSCQKSLGKATWISHDVFSNAMPMHFEHSVWKFRFSKTRKNGLFLAVLMNFCPLKSKCSSLAILNATFLWFSNTVMILSAFLRKFLMHSQNNIEICSSPKSCLRLKTKGSFSNPPNDAVRGRLLHAGRWLLLLVPRFSADPLTLF